MARKARDIQDRAFNFGCEVIEFCDSVPDLRATTRYVLWPPFKAGTSVGSNLEEASAGQSKADFIAKTAVSLKEARESHYWLRVISAKRPALAATAKPIVAGSRQAGRGADEHPAKRPFRPRSRLTESAPGCER